MAETIPLLFKPHLGGLHPVNPAAEKAVAALVKGAPVKIEIKRTRGNQGRLALYWVVLGKAAGPLSDKCEGDALDEAMLHRVLKDRRGLYTTTILPSGETVKNYDSIGFAKMTEPERNDYVQWAFETLAKWLGIEPAQLTSD